MRKVLSRAITSTTPNRKSGRRGSRKRNHDNGTTTLANNSESTPNIFVKGKGNDAQVITALAEKASVQIDKNSFTLKSEIANVTAPVGKKIKFGSETRYTVNGITFDAAEDTEAETIQRGIKFDLSTGTVEFDSLSLESSSTAQISQQNPELVILTDGAIVKALGDNKFKYYNRRFAFEGAVEIVGKKFESDRQVRGGLIYFETSEAEWNEDGTYTTETYVTTGFVAGNKYVGI